MSTPRSIQPLPGTGFAAAKVVVVALFGNLLTLGLLWSSHDTLEERIDAAQPSLTRVDARLGRAETELESMRTRVSEHSREMHVLKNSELLKLPDVVDLANPGAQHIGRGFAISRLRVEPLASGSLVRGTLINMQSVEHRDAVFVVSMRGVDHELTLPLLEAGGSTPFSVFLPETTAELAPYLRIAFRQSTIVYRLEPSEESLASGP